MPLSLPDYVVSAVKAHAHTPGARSFYLYDTRVMRGKIAHLQKLLPAAVKVYYAMKANPHPAFLGAAKEAGAEGIEIASLGEGERALAAGFTPAQVIFTGPGKSPEELEWSVAKRIHTVHVESLAECHRLNAIAGKHNIRQPILLRVNPNFHIHGAQASFSGDSSKLGLDEAQLDAAMPQILALPNLEFQGLHVYAASGVLQVSDLLKNCEMVFTLAQRIEKAFQGVRCATIDFGGGFGIDYLQAGNDFSPEKYAEELKKLIAQYGFADRRFVLELGRYLTADSGWYATEILDIKDSLGKKQVVCAGGSHHFRRPVALGINHPVEIVAMQQPKLFDGQESVHDENVFIGGPLCNSADKLAPKDVPVKRAEIGDMAVFMLAGAYGLSMSHNDFLSHARPPEILLG